MPLPMITPELLASSRPLMDGWNLVTITGIRTQPKESGSVNYFIDFIVKSGPGTTTDNVGKKSSWMVSGGGLAAGIDDLCKSYIQFVVAVTGVAPDQVLNSNLPDEAFVNHDVWVKIGKTISADGKKYTNFEMCYPPDKVPF